LKCLLSGPSVVLGIDDGDRFRSRLRFVELHWFDMSLPELVEWVATMREEAEEPKETEGL
jgi:hypothetical protein